MSPKIVNGSFAAMIDADEFLAKAYAGIRIAVSFLINLSKEALYGVQNSNFPHLPAIFFKTFHFLEPRLACNASPSPRNFNVRKAIFTRLSHGSGHTGHRSDE